jgi:hypothetical protein
LESLVAEATTTPQQHLIAEAVDVVVFIDEDGSVLAAAKLAKSFVPLDTSTVRLSLNMFEQR